MLKQLSTLLFPLLVTVSLARGATYQVDPAQGDDTANGVDRPWRTINHAMDQLAPGDTLVLAGGRYFETVTCSLWGEADAPITITGAPGEQAVIDGGIVEFFEHPQDAWEPVPGTQGGAPGEFRSTRPYRNLPDVAGSFPDRPIRLNTYWRLADLRSDNETHQRDPDTRLMLADVYAGPGLWYDRQSGRIHIRLAHTHIESDLIENYTGGTDPRTIPLSITSFRTTPLVIDGARHLHIENLTITGGGQITLLLNESQAVTIDRLNLHAGNFSGQKSGHIRVTNCVFNGGLPPWVWRIDVSGGSADSGTRDIIRSSPLKIVFDTSHVFQSHNLPRVIANDLKMLRPLGRSDLKPDSDDAIRNQMVYMLQNHDWEIAHCEIRQGHDGLFLAGKNMDFHHSLIEDVQDDAFDPSSPVAFITDGVHVHHNLIRRCVTAISSHNYRDRDGWVYIYHNIFDLREPMAWNRPTDGAPAAARFPRGFLLHGAGSADSIEAFYIAHNTFIHRIGIRYDFAAGTMNDQKPGSARRLFNNLFIYLDAYPVYYISRSLEKMDVAMDGNFHYSTQQPPPENYLQRLREHPFSAGQWEAHSQVGDPRLRALDSSPRAVNDYRPQPDSPLVGAAVRLPGDQPVIQSMTSQTIGAFALDDEPLRVGVDGRITAGQPR